MARRRLLAIVLMLPLLLLPSAAVAAPPATRGEAAGTSTVIAADLTGPLRLAISPTGQTLYVLRPAAGDVLAIDVTEGVGRRWTAVPAVAGAVPHALGVIDSGTLAAVVQEGDAWSIRVHRLGPPGMPAEVGGADSQTVALGTSAAAPGEVRLAVSPGREWLAVTGLPSPLPAILRTTVTGVRLGAASQRRCPRIAGPPSALMVGPYGEWGFIQGSGDGAAGEMLSWFSPSGGQRLLHLDTGLERVRDAVSCRETGLLWALGEGRSDTGVMTGLWRVDAAFVAGRQAVAAVPLMPFSAPAALVCLPKGDVIVADCGERSTIVRVTPGAAASAADAGRKGTP